MNEVVAEGWDVWTGVAVWNRSYASGQLAVDAPRMTPDGAVMLITLSSTFAALNTSTGEEVWRLRPPVLSTISDLQLIHVNATRALTYALSPFASRMFYVDVFTGNVTWQMDVVNAQLFTCQVVPSDTTVVVCVFSGAAAGYSSRGDGTLLWHLSQIFSSSLVCSLQGVAYMTQNSGTALVAVNATSGAVIHRRTNINPNEVPSFQAIDAASNAYATSSKSLFAYNGDVTLRWNVSVLLPAFPQVALLPSGDLSVLAGNATLLIWAAQPLPSPSATPSATPSHTPSRSPFPSRSSAPTQPPPPANAPQGLVLPPLDPITQFVLIALAISFGGASILFGLLVLRRRWRLPLTPRHVGGCFGVPRRALTPEEIERAELQVEIRLFVMFGLVGAGFAALFYYCIVRRAAPRPAAPDEAQQIASAPLGTAVSMEANPLLQPVVDWPRSTATVELASNGSPPPPAGAPPRPYL